eukprot:c19347_g1_i1 orf=273-1001(+)
MQQPQQQHISPHMGAYSPHNVTTEVIQKYLDENKQLILAILDNQNLGKLNECAQYQARLQANLMFLASIADAQPQPPPVHAQVPPQAVLQQGSHFMSHPQAQQQLAQQSALMMNRNPLQYTQQQLSSLHQVQQLQQQQQTMHGQHALNAGGTNNLPLISGESTVGVSSSIPSGGFPDFVRGGTTGDGLQVNRGLGGDIRGSKSDVPDAGHSASGDGSGGSGSGQAANEPDPSYLKASEEDGN